MSTQYLVINAVGPDRPGLVDSISQYVYQRGGNVEASRMATLGDQFAILMLVSAEGEKIGVIADQLDQLEAESALRCRVTPTAAPPEHAPAAEALPYELTVASMDHPGIVRAVSHHLAERGVNIAAMDTRVEHAPHTGTSLFILTARLDVPAQTNIPRFRNELNALAEDLNVDISLAVAGD